MRTSSPALFGSAWQRHRWRHYTSPSTLASLPANCHHHFIFSGLQSSQQSGPPDHSLHARNELGPFKTRMQSHITSDHLPGHHFHFVSCDVSISRCTFLCKKSKGETSLETTVEVRQLKTYFFPKSINCSSNRVTPGNTQHLFPRIASKFIRLCHTFGNAFTTLTAILLERCRLHPGLPDLPYGSLVRDYN